MAHARGLGSILELILAVGVAAACIALFGVSVPQRPEHSTR